MVAFYIPGNHFIFIFVCILPSLSTCVAENPRKIGMATCRHGRVPRLDSDVKNWRTRISLGKVKIKVSVDGLNFNL
jgi:hypothetical protein